MSSKSPEQLSIRRMLLAWLLVPLASLWLLSIATGYYFALNFANERYDRVLLNSADSVAARLKWSGDKVVVDLPPAALAILRHNEQDRFYYQILKTDLSRISGDTVIPGPVVNPNSDQPVFRYATINGAEVRIARIKAELPHSPGESVLVQVAETLNSRNLLAQQILLSIVVPQLILIVLGAVAVSVGISRGLSPLNSLRHAVSRRSRHDLTPLSPEEAPAEVRPLVDEINLLLARIRKDLESQQRFIANAAHQLRTPLAGLKTYIGYARRLSSGNQMKLLLGQIDTGTDRLTHLVNQLLALARAEPATQLRSNHGPVDLNFVASEATSDLVPEALERNIDLEFEGSTDAAMVKGDASYLRELCVNIIENAVRYTQEGGRVAVRVTNGQDVRLSVQDNGPGVPEEEREHVFERFYRVLGTGVPGSGLGLSIVKEIAEAHEADVSLGAGPGESGTMVTVTFKKLDRS